MTKDVLNLNDELVGDKIGDLNRRFIKEMEGVVVKLFGYQFSLINSMNSADILKAAQELYTKADSVCKGRSMIHSTSTYKTKLSAFSGWLSEYDINNYRRHD